VIQTTGGWTVDETTPYGVEQAVASSGTGVAMTMNASGFTTTLYGIVSLKSASVPSTETGAVTMHLGGVSFSVGEKRTETVTATMALKGISYTAAGTAAKAGNATLALGKANFIINAIDVTAISSLAHFYTF
jgi:hypothetical protein